jgi:hypothetical protein
MGTGRILPYELILPLSHARAAQHKPRPHPWPGFVTSHGFTAHLHAFDGLIGTIIGLGHALLLVNGQLPDTALLYMKDRNYFHL